jgi:hypothetical protein
MIDSTIPGVLALALLSAWTAAAAAQAPTVPGALPGTGVASDGGAPRVAVSVGDVQVEQADADVAPIARVLRARIAIPRACLTREAASLRPGATLALRFAVGDDGRVSEASARERGRDVEDPVRACVVARYLERLTFPPGAPARVSATLRYELPDRSDDDAAFTATEVAAARTEARAARQRASCLSRAGRRLEAAVARLEAARGRGRARALVQLRAARAELAACDGLLRDVPPSAFGIGTPSDGTGFGTRGDQR